MKHFIYIMSFLLICTTATYAQDDGPGKMDVRMKEYLQRRLNLSGNEAEKFGPVFLEYFNELRRTNQQYRNDQLLLQRKTADLKLKYRNEFKDIMGEKRSNDVFNYERDFINEVKRLREDRVKDKIEIRGNKKGGLLQ